MSLPLPSLTFRASLTEVASLSVSQRLKFPYTSTASPDNPSVARDKKEDADTKLAVEDEEGDETDEEYLRRLYPGQHQAKLMAKKKLAEAKEWDKSDESEISDTTEESEEEEPYWKWAGKLTVKEYSELSSEEKQLLLDMEKEDDHWERPPSKGKSYGPDPATLRRRKRRVERRAERERRLAVKAAPGGKVKAKAKATRLVERWAPYAV